MTVQMQVYVLNTVMLDIKNSLLENLDIRIKLLIMGKTVRFLVFLSVL